MKIPKKFTAEEKLRILLEYHLVAAGKPSFDSVAELLKHYGANRENLSQWRRQLNERIGDVFTDDRIRRRRLILEKKLEHCMKQNEELRRRLGDFDDVDEVD